MWSQGQSALLRDVSWQPLKGLWGRRHDQPGIRGLWVQDSHYGGRRANRQWHRLWLWSVKEAGAYQASGPYNRGSGRRRGCRRDAGSMAPGDRHNTAGSLWWKPVVEAPGAEMVVFLAGFSGTSLSPVGAAAGFGVRHTERAQQTGCPQAVCPWWAAPWWWACCG